MSRLISPTADASPATTSMDIEAIVRRVLSQLMTEHAAHPVKDSEPASRSSLTLNERVISVETVKGIANTVNTLQVSARTVVTPAARDELRQRGIELIRTNASAANASTGTASKVPTSSQPGSRAIHLDRDGDVGDHLFAAIKKQVTARGVRLCSQASLTVILSSRPATTAHQRSGPRRCVVAINRIDDVSRFMAELSPNVFVLDVRHLHLVAIAGAISTIARPVIAQVHPVVTVAGGLS